MDGPADFLFDRAMSTPGFDQKEYEQGLAAGDWFSVLEYAHHLELSEKSRRQEMSVYYQ